MKPEAQHSLTFLRYPRKGERAADGSLVHGRKQLWLYFNGAGHTEVVFNNTMDALRWAMQNNIEAFVPPRADKDEQPMKWKLVDVEAKAREASQTFEIPGYTERNTILSGDHVKLSFESENGVERAWCKVLSPGFAVLANDPTITPMQLGDPVRYEARHIIDIIRKADLRSMSVPSEAGNVGFVHDKCARPLETILGTIDKAKRRQ